MSGTRQVLTGKKIQIIQMGCGGGYLVMLGGKTHCYNSSFSLAEISRRFTQEGDGK